jgi:hypothetical protein
VERGLLLAAFCSMEMVGDSFERLVLRLLHLPEELPRVRRQALHVPSLSLGIEGVEGERALAAPLTPLKTTRAFFGRRARRT